MNSPVYLAPDFEHLLEPYAVQPIHLSDNTIYGLRPDLTLAYLNRGWERFAANNGGEPAISNNWKLGRCILDAIPRQLRYFYSNNFAKCLEEQRPWTHFYDGPSPQLERKMCMTAFPLGEREGFLVVHSLIREVLHTQRCYEALDSVYRLANGFVRQCSNCRRVQRYHSAEVWDWVPHWVESPPKNTVHELCEPCLGYHHSNKHEDSANFPDEFRRI